MSNEITHIKLNNIELEKLHEELLFLLLEVDRICRKHNIKYFLAYGTLIGAIRHKGFIPWDDDADIQMLRKDYDKFCRVCEFELDTEKFFLQTHQTDKFYNWVYGKLRMKNTEYVRSGQEHLKQNHGIFIDIFPIDNITEKPVIQKIFRFNCKLCRKILWSDVGKKVVKENNIRILYKFLSLIPKNMVIYLFEVIAKFYNNKNLEFLATYYGEYTNNKGSILKKEWYDKVIEVEFEGYKFKAPIGYNDILTLVYGDFMQLPKEEDRNGSCFPSYVKFSDSTELKI